MCRAECNVRDRTPARHKTPATHSQYQSGRIRSPMPSTATQPSRTCPSPSVSAWVARNPPPAARGSRPGRWRVRRPLRVFVSPTGSSPPRWSTRDRRTSSVPAEVSRSRPSQPHNLRPTQPCQAQQEQHPQVLCGRGCDEGGRLVACERFTVPLRLASWLHPSGRVTGYEAFVCRILKHGTHTMRRNVSGEGTAPPRDIR